MTAAAATPERSGPGFLARLDRGWRRIAAFWPLALLAFALLLFLPMLDARPFGREEGRRALQALAILQGGSWWRLEVLGEPYINKPPLLPWLIALAGGVLGRVDEWATRLPAVLSVALGAVSAGAMARLAAEREPQLSALAAGLFYLGCVFIFLKGRVGETDTLATAFVGCGFLVWAAARRGGHIGALGWTGVGACFALAAFTKGPVPLLFALPPMLALPLIERRPRELVGLAAALLIAAAPLAVWLALNRDVVTAGYLAAEMRLKPEHAAVMPRWIGPFDVLASLLPGLIPAAFWAASRPGGLTSAEQRLPLALVLFAAPVALAIALWPESKSRYVMPIAWPVAAMAGLGIGWFWQRGRAAALGVTATAALAILATLATLALDRGSAGQVERRERAAAIRTALAEVPPGPLLVLWSQEVDQQLTNALANAGRPVARIAPEGLSRPAVGLFADAASKPVIQANGGWRATASIDGGFLTFYRPAEPDGR